MVREKYRLMNSDDVKRTVKRIAHQIIEEIPDTENLVLIGIKTRGVPLARTIAEEIEKISGKQIPVGALDITFYRDDLSLVGEKPEVKGTEMDFDITDKDVVLVDDVLYTGRTTRAALDEIMDYGRPRRVKLCVLIDRGHRELPICPDFVGKTITTTKKEIVKVKFEETDGVTEVVIAEKEA
ncbi:MAG TPA: bifunctional pyr operon transcriptional regulator/uracil phosphoribosyltransferase PyrR [candidate division WOR-3 bacterium]|uniref:Bifunctional protein PyrR n=1 Tax=candidate division WOR-3 bacterium TaxID=2052148 RepID=A0A7V5HND6_UNCW3|nr:bifunctional pyr operon transcriptional regulator/uracil phosphoribosyltransferase PyrR [candidate division WOR-3 bacterium]